MRDYVIDWMVSNGIILTVENYTELNYGEPLKLEDLSGEHYAELLDLIEENILVSTESRHKN